MKYQHTAAIGALLGASAASAQWGTNGADVFHLGEVGIGINNPLHPLHVRTTTAARGIMAENLAPGAVTFGVWGQSAAPAGRGVFGWANRATGVNFGVQGQSASTSGRGVLGWATAATGTTYGVWGESASNVGVGVVGRANGPSPETIGVLGHSVEGVGVQGMGGQTGVKGQGHGTDGIGVLGIAVQSTGHAGYFSGGRNFFEGSVGIGPGTEDPQGVLDIRVGSAGGRFQFYQDSGGTTAIRSVGGNFPGAFRLRGSVEVRPHNGSSSNAAITIWNEEDTNKNSRFTANGASYFRGGPVAIGTADPGSFLFAVNGSAAKPGGGSWSVFSDERLKTNIEPLRGTLDRLLALHGYTFNYLPEAVDRRLALPGTQTGLLAQEVEAVFPDWVGEDESGYKYVTERATTAIMVEALRDLRAEKDRQLAARDAEIERVRAENAGLRERLERVEEQIAALVSLR